MNRFLALLILAIIPLAACDSDVEVDVATTGDTTAGTAAPSAPTTEVSPTGAQDTNTGTTELPVQTGKLNVNTATAEQLKTIPGVGDKMVHEFEEYRPYASIQQFRKEIGKYVDAAQVATYENYLFVPIDYNTSDAATLTQIPGITEGEANQIVAARPYASEPAFFEKLGEFLSPTEIATARTYVVAQ